jgi:flavin-dependent dehydrogenase
VLPGLARGLLDHLGVWAAFQQQNYRPVFATAISWGEVALRENHTIYSARGHGWHLDRSAFDALLADQARIRGVELYAGVSLTEIHESDGGWRLSLSDGTGVDARFVVDATGRGASVARQVSAHVLVLDGLMGFARYFRVPGGCEPRTMIEAFPDGWWYAATLEKAGEQMDTQRPMAANTVAIVAMTDLDLARDLQLEREIVWRQMLARTEWIHSLVPADARAEATIVRAAGSALLDPVCGDAWLAVGDAASAYDPLSAQGIVKSLRSGIFAAYAIAERLEFGGHAGLDRYRHFVRQSFQAYQEAYLKFYAMEARWRDRPFWARRQNTLRST